MMFKPRLLGLRLVMGLWNMPMSYLNRGYYKNAHVLFNLLNKLREKDTL